LRISVLGQLTVTDDGGHVLPAGELPRRARQVLAVLAARHDRIQSKDALADAVWGAELPGNHVAALEHYVSVIRRRLQPLGSAATWFIVTRGGGYLFDTSRAALDLAELRSRIRRLDALPPDSPERLAVHEEILELARELPFPEDPYADWAESARNEVQVAAVTTRLELAGAALPQDGARSLRLAQEAIELNPYLEPAYRAAMAASVAINRPDDALRFFERCRRLLHEELGVGPSIDLVRLQRQVLASRHPEPAEAGVPLLKQVPQERFLGRVAAIRLVLEPDQPKVVHIVGPAGSGKTAFLAELGRHMVGRVGVGNAGSSVGVQRLTWLRAALVQLGAKPEALAAVDAAAPDQPLGRDELEMIGTTFAGGDPLFLAVDDADGLDAASVAELAWLAEHHSGLRIVLTYRYPSKIDGSPVAGLGTPVVLRLAPLTEPELAPFGDDTVFARTGGIPALVAVAHRPREIALGVAMQIARRRTRWMPAAAWEVLRLCAVLGPLGAGELARLTGRPVAEVLVSIDHLMHAHLLGEGPDGLVAHRSTMVREAVAEQVSGPSRMHLRQQLAAAS
jgi:DNA-binding SARP family transcriptional activator